jgi:hypothetical protein
VTGPEAGEKGVVETLTRKDIEHIDNGAFGKFNGTKVEY